MTNSKSIVLNETEARYCISVIKSVSGYVKQQNTKIVHLPGKHDMYAPANISCLNKLEQELEKAKRACIGVAVLEETKWNMQR